MKKNKIGKKWSLGNKLALGILMACMLLFSTVIGIVYWKQDTIVQNIVDGFNSDFDGIMVIGDTDISPFASFPYIAVVIENVQVYEDKADMFAPILDVSNISLGFNFWTLIKGDIEVNLLKVENGNFDIVRYQDGTFNLVRALSGKRKIKEIKEAYNIELEKIELANLDIIKFDESTNIHAETYIKTASSKFKNAKDILMIGLKSQLILNVINDGDSTIFKNKNIDAETALVYDKPSGLLTIQPSEFTMENGVFDIAGTIDILHEFDLDLRINGGNSNFNLLIAFAPEELMPALKSYENAGNIFFDTYIKGKSLSGQAPAIEAEFGCDSAYFINPISKKVLKEISFRGHFTNGEERNMRTMAIMLNNITAKPEAGTFNANLSVKNFETPEIEMSLDSDFDLDFLAKFLNVTTLENLDGDVSLHMKFRDIVDLNHPEKSLEKLSQSYFSELTVNNLSFRIPDYPVLFDSIDIKASMEGTLANIEYLYMNIGASDVTIRGDINNLPAIVHQGQEEIEANLFVFSDMLDLKELTSYDTVKMTPIDDKLENMRLELAFKSTGKALVQSVNLPTGDFFIKNFYCKPEKYPHTLKKFNAHAIIGEKDIEILEFNGKIDQSDFQYAGKLYDYANLQQDTIRGVLDLDFSITSEQLKLYDLLAYGGINYMPEDYRNEVISELAMYGNAQFYFKDTLQSSDIYFDQLNAKLNIHDMEIEDVYGKISFEGDQVTLKSVSGQIGNTDFTTNIKLYTGENDSIRKLSNYVSLQAETMDFDQLSNYTSSHADTVVLVDADSVFNIYKLPFTDIAFDFDIDKLTYHRHHIQNLKAGFQIQKDHIILIDSLKLETAGGMMDIGGYFDGSDHDNILFFPSIKLQRVNMDQMLYRFENFGQSNIVSENLSGKLSGTITGQLKMRPDMIPKLDESELLLDIEIVNGRLKNYEPMKALAQYFTDKNLYNIQFDTLSNTLQLDHGTIIIPKMTINSSLGFMDISGKQGIDNHMEYYFRLPLGMVTKSASQKLFGKKEAQIDSTQVDKIQYKRSGKTIWYANLKLEGTPDDFKVSLERKRK